jgi:uncharacterized membrane protein
MDIAQLLALWVHTLAFVIAWGYYGILGRMVLPALRGTLDAATEARTLVALERRALPLVVLSTALFVVSGTYLLLVDSRYEGLGNFFANTWTTLMAVKHLVVVVLVVLAVMVDRFIRRAGESTNDATRASNLGRVRLAAEAATGLGALIVLLTAAAQLS